MADRLLLDADEAEAGVVEDHHDHVEVQPSEGLQLGQHHAQATVAGEADHLAAGRDEGRGDGGREREPHGGQPAGDQELPGAVDLPHRHGDEHVRARVDRGDGAGRRLLAGDGDHLLRGERAGFGRGRGPQAVERREPVPGALRRLPVRRPGVQPVEEARQISDDLDDHVTAEERAVVDGPRAEEHQWCGVGPGRGDELDRIEAHTEDEVRPLQERGFDRRARGQPGRIRAPVPDHAPRLVGREDRDVGAGEELVQRIDDGQAASRRDGDRTDADDDHRPPSTGERGADDREVDDRIGPDTTHDGRFGGLRAAERRGGIEVEMDRSGPPAERERQRLGRQGRVVRAVAPRRLGDGREQRGLVQALVRHPRPVGIRDAVGHQDHGLAVEQGLGDAVHGAGRARATGHDADARRPGELADHPGHDRRRRLAVGEHEPAAHGLRRPDDVEVGAPARHAEDELPTGRLHHLHEVAGHLGLGHRRRDLGHGRSRRRGTVGVGHERAPAPGTATEAGAAVVGSLSAMADIQAARPTGHQSRPECA